MKANLHPEMKDAKVTCVCGATFNTKSVKTELRIETCDKCHPYYTGAQGKAKRAGNIEKFNKKYNLEKEAA